jgi:hypothetical protein
MTELTTITIETAMAITDRRSKRTWMRRLEEGAVRQVGPDAGLQTRLVLQDVLPAAAIPFSADMEPLLMQASMGHAEAQAELGQMFCLADRSDLGAYWLQQAAERGSADAMQWLAVLSARGLGITKDEVESLRWLRRAAQLGHAIAREQLGGLRAA